MRRICIFAFLSLLTATSLYAQQVNKGGGTESQHIERVMIRGNDEFQDQRSSLGSAFVKPIHIALSSSIVM